MVDLQEINYNTLLDMLLLQVSAITILLAAWYVLRFFQLTKKAGLDPSLLTYISPLQAYSHKPTMALGMGMLAIFVLSPSLCSFLSVALCLCAGAHIGLLICFGRGHTQPLMFYSLFGLAMGGLHIRSVVAFVFSCLIFCSSLTYLWYWKKISTQRYCTWVKNKVTIIHNMYFRQLKPKPNELDWYCTLLVATTESIARPKASRIIEHIYYILKRPQSMSSGIMQVASNTYLSDLQSVQKGHDIIHEIMAKMPHTYTKDEDKMSYLAKEYNGSYGYQQYLYAVYPG